MKRMHCHLAVLMAKKNPRLTQRQLARELDVAPATINKLYNGRPLTSVIKPDIVEKICDYFSCDIGDLFALSDESGSTEGNGGTKQ